jgi:hypothetical protein
VSFWLASPFYLYVAVYILSTVVSLFYGAQPILLPSFNPHKEELRREWIADVQKLGTIPNFFFVVAIHEIESCFYNPGEVFPNGYLDTSGSRDVFFEPKKVYVGQTHYIFTLGFPRTRVMACGNPNL